MIADASKLGGSSTTAFKRSTAYDGQKGLWGWMVGNTYLGAGILFSDIDADGGPGLAYLRNGAYLGNGAASLAQTNFRLLKYAAVAPTTEPCVEGDILLNPQPSGGYVGWSCTVSGTPGTWAAFGPVNGNATRINGALIPASKTVVGTNSSGQIVDASSATLSNNTSGKAAGSVADSIADGVVDVAPSQNAVYDALALKQDIPGAWPTPTYDAANFTAQSAMTWTVESGDVKTYAYTTVGKKMTVAFYIATSTVGGTPANRVYIKIPDSKVATKHVRTTCVVLDNGTAGIGMADVAASGTTISIYKDAVGNNFSAATNTTEVYGEIEFEIN
jgi:hypothetical protein